MVSFSVDTISLYEQRRRITEMKSKIKLRVKAYLEVAPILIDFVYSRRIWFATSSDPSTCFFSVV